jgi:hypothetical protein
MSSFRMLSRMALVRTDVSEEGIASIISVTRIGELGTTLAVTSNRSTMRRNTMHANVVPSSPNLVTDDGGDSFLRNDGSYKSDKV